MSHLNPDFIVLYTLFRRLDARSVKKIRGALNPNDLFYCPPFYRLLVEFNIKREDRFSWSRLVYCLPYLTHSENGRGLGHALARLPIAFKRSQLSRVMLSSYPDDIIELRDLLNLVHPIINWEIFAHTLWHWEYGLKQSILHDFIHAQMSMAEEKSLSIKEVQNVSKSNRY